jgi:sigma-E factor negative regulatory protein RseB
VYSDGLAAVSVYIEDPASNADRPERLERHGTTHALTKSTGGRIVTVVGDVPAATVLMIGKSVEPATVR